MVLWKRKVWFTGAHFATEMWEAMWGQGESTISPRAATCFMSRTVQSARKHGVMRTVARCAQLLFGHRSHVGALRSRMTRRRENDARRNIGTFPTKRRCACCRGTASVDAQQETAVARVAANTTRDGCGQSAWSKLPRGILRVWSLANSRLERPNNDGLWTQTTGWKALTTNACRQSACGPGCRVKAAAGYFTGLRAGKRQAWTPYNNRGPWRQTAGFKALRPNACGQSAWSKLPRDILGVGRRANGRGHGRKRQAARL